MTQLKSTYNVFIADSGPYVVQATSAENATKLAEKLHDKSPQPKPDDSTGGVATDDATMTDTDGDTVAEGQGK